MNALSLWLTRFGIVMVLVLLSACLLVPIYLALAGILEAHPVLRTLSGVVLLGWFLAITFLADGTAKRMVFDSMGIGDAFRQSTAEARVAMAFLPIVGRWIGPRREGAPHDPIE